MLDDLMLSIFQDDPEQAYRQLSTGQETDPLWQRVIQTLTIGETYFLRDRAHFRLLRAHILPQLIERRRSSRTLNIWSAGCATGEEPYSLAITLKEILPDIDNWTVQILGTDINAQALQTAQRGIYRQWAFRHTNTDFQERYFERAADGMRIKADIQRLVTYRQTNLFNKPASAPFDLILCRNVLLYFSSEHTRHAEQMLFNALAPGGWLLMGNAEAVRYHRDQWITHVFPETPAYQKPDQPLKRETGEHIQSHMQNTTSKALSGDTAPQSLYEAAIHCLQHEAFDEAQTTLDALLVTEPDHAAAHTLRAYLLANRSDFNAAQDALTRALELDPLMADAYYLRASLCFESNLPDETVNALRAALYCQRNHPLAAFLMGNIQAQAGDLAKATRYWQNTLNAIKSLKPDSPVSNVSNITAGQLQTLVQEQLRGWR